MASQITEEEDKEDPTFVVDSEAQRNKVRQIIKYQKYLYYSSSSSSSLSSAGASGSSFASPARSRSLLDLMKGGSTSLGRLFDMEHTSLKTYLNEYSGSPMIKPIFLWGSDSDNGSVYDPWISIKQAQNRSCKSGLSSDDHSLNKIRRSNMQNTRLPVAAEHANRRLTRKKSFRRLPRFRLWVFSRFRIFRFRLRLRRLRVMICGRKF